MSPAADTRTRLVALLLFIALPVSLFVLAGLNLVGLREARSLAGTTEAQLARLTGRVAQAGSAGAMEDFSSVFVAAGSRSLAEAELQRQVVKMIEQASATVIESVAADMRTDDIDNSIAVRATFDTTNDPLLGLLRTIETGMPLMYVDEIAVRRLQNDGVGGGVEPVLRVDLRVRSQYRAGAQ